LDIGKQLRELRETKGLSKTYLAFLAGVPQHEISELEDGNGNPSSPVLERLSEALGVELNQVSASEPQPEDAALTEGASLQLQERTLLDLFAQLADDERELLISLAEDLVKQK
jgi:transcriptional regulator with XRE-family HTH domain